MPSSDDQANPAGVPVFLDIDPDTAVTEETAEAAKQMNTNDYTVSAPPVTVSHFNGAVNVSQVDALPDDVQAALDQKETEFQTALRSLGDTVESIGDQEALLGVVPPTTAPAEKARVRLLREAAGLITGDREHEYGTPQVNFQRIADLWNVQFNHLLAEDKKFQPVDVALGMIQVKMGRAVQTPNEDTFKDIAGYTGIAYELTQDED
jgi:hypothetical protein